MNDIQPRRSVLYVPADKPRALAKARTLSADAIIVDLEDSVAPEAKGAAREAFREAFVEGFPGEAAVRVNGVGTEWFTEDVLAAIATGADAILLPKVEGPDSVRTLADALDLADALEKVEIWAMIETPRALLDLHLIASLAKSGVPLAAFTIGTNDLSLATRVPLTEDRAAFVPWFMQIVAAARAYGIDIIDGPLNDFRNLARLEAECRQARALGMDGKSLIHPNQIEVANRLFAPSIAEQAEAEAVAAAFARTENRGKGAIAVDGRMVELLHLEQAQRLLALAAAIRSREAE
jgi:citrate lyase subunit beta / citryl-CoA lyase